METIIVLSEKDWNANTIDILRASLPDYNWVLINSKDNFNYANLSSLSPRYIFIPHWSYIIPEEIFEAFECIVFHMTDLPFGRGGSPLQNLIERGFDVTKVSALRVVRELDAGPIYLKQPLSLLGTAEEIFVRANKLIEKMIIEIIKDELQAVKQEGTPEMFKRRTPEMSSVSEISEINKMFDHIRMLDAEGYPKAFIEGEHFKFEFTRAALKANETIIADVRIIKK